MPGTRLPLWFAFALVLALVPPLSVPHASAIPFAFKNPLGVAVDRDGKRAYVALNGAGMVAVVDLRDGRVLKEIRVGSGPYDVALHGEHLYVACEDEDRVVRVNLEREIAELAWPTGQAPRGVAVHPDGSRLFVACHDAKRIDAIEIADGRTKSLPVEAWPERVEIHRDTQLPYLLVLTGNEKGAIVHLATCDHPPKVVATSRLPGISNPRGLASKQGASSFVVLVHQQPRDKVPVTQVAQGWVFTNAITTFSPWGIDTPKGSVAPAKVLDEPGHAYADPSDVALAPDQRHAFVGCGGADAVLVLRTDRFVNANYGPLAASGDGDTIHPRNKDDLSLSHRYVIARIPTQANPRRLTLSGDGATLVVSNTLDDSLTVIDARTYQVRRHIKLGGAVPDAARRGERLFHSARMTSQRQFSCASCHPGDGSDGLNWDLSRDGLGNFLNTRALRGVADTAPYGWHGTSPTLVDRVTGTLRLVHRHEPLSGEADDLAAYLASLKPLRSLPISPEQRETAGRGKVLFEGKAKCSACHQGSALSDTITHDVSTKIDGDIADRFDVPSLRNVARTAPYLHHGKAATLEEVFTKYNERRRHGGAHLLTPAEMADLLAYLRSL